MTFECPALKFAHAALEPYLNEESVRFHYEKHTKGYFKKTNELIKGTDFANTKSLDDLLTKDSLMKVDSKLFNQAAQAWNHVLWWENLAPKLDCGEPSEQLMKLIEDKWTNFKTFKATFEESAMNQFASGWCWLVWKNSGLSIITTPNAGTPLTTDAIPLLVVDLWEHAWYFSYPADKEKYLKQIWHIINWSVINERFRDATSNK